MLAFDLNGNYQLQTIINLRNPTLEQRHWIMLENLLGFQLDKLDKPLSLQFLDGHKAFEFAEQIEDISGQASSEASLEVMMKKVD